MFSSRLRNAIFKLPSENNYIELEIQKDFALKISGTLEHTTQMSNIINKARINQRSQVITLLDFRNAFDEVHHNLIYEVLRYQHIPDPINHLIESLYSGFHTSIITPDFHTCYIPIGRGVLQGDCLSPLLFNLCFNTFIQHIKAPNHRQFGFLVDCCKILIQFTGFNLQTMQLLLVVKRVKINTFSIVSPFGASGHTLLIELMNVSPLELENQQQDQSNTWRNS